MFKYVILIVLFLVSVASATDEFHIQYSELFADAEEVEIDPDYKELFEESDQKDSDRKSLTNYEYFVKWGEAEAKDELLLDYPAPENSLGAEMEDLSPEDRAELEEDLVLLLEEKEAEAIKADEEAEAKAIKAEAESAVADDKMTKLLKNRRFLQQSLDSKREAPR